MIKKRNLVEVENDFDKIDIKKLHRFNKIKLVTLSNYSTQFLNKSMKLAAYEDSISLEILDTGYNQWEFSILDFDNIEKDFKPDYILITLASQLFFYSKSNFSEKDIFSYLSDMISNLYNKTNAKIIFTDFEIFDDNLFSYFNDNTINEKINKLLKEKFFDKILFINYDHFINYIGHENWVSKKFLITSKLHCSPNYYFTLGDYFYNFITSIKRKRIRHIILDLDNTLWGGVVGDLGYNNVDLSYESIGLEFLKFQNFLLSLHNKGIILSICSKNNKEIVLEVFNKRKEMILKIEHFANIKINWQPKSENINSILSELNLTTVGTCFLDDSAFEREEVKHRFPDIYVPSLPEERTQWLDYLIFSNNFLIPTVKEEDLYRKKFYIEESKRANEKNSFSNIEDFLNSLNLKLRINKIKKDNCDRALELINKTNQFNFLSKQINHSDFNSLINENYAFSFSLEDKFSNYGEIGVLVGIIKENKCIIDNWVLSCRAMSKTVENAMLEHLITELKLRNVKQVECILNKTKHNIPIHNLLENFNFKVSSESKLDKKYIADISKLDSKNKFIKFV